MRRRSSSSRLSRLCAAASLRLLPPCHRACFLSAGGVAYVATLLATDAALSGLSLASATANCAALCAAAEPHDLWFHLEGDSSPHVILQGAGEPCAQAIADCCQLCKNHSKKKAAKWAKAGTEASRFARLV